MKQQPNVSSLPINEEEKFYPIDSRFIWSNRFIQVKQSEGNLRCNLIGSVTEKLIKSLNLNTNKIGQTDPFEIVENMDEGTHFLKINYLSASHIEHILLQEIKKQEPYFEEEKRKIRLQLTPDTTSDVAAYVIELKIDTYKKLLDLQSEDEIESQN